jgi:hypothetical protein
MNTKIVIIFCSTVIIVGILFWPTIYRYDKIVTKNYTIPIRINRITGYTEEYHPAAGGWVSFSEEKDVTKKAIPLPLQEKMKINGNAGFKWDNRFAGWIYNGSKCIITEIIVRIKAKNKDGSIRWERKFRKETYIKPLTQGALILTVADSKDASAEWSIEEVLGICNQK